MKHKNKVLLSQLALLMVAFIWGGGFIVVKNSLETISPLWLMAIRFQIAALSVSLIFYKKIKLINKEILKAGIICGIFIYVAFVFQTVGIAHTTASKNALLTASYVVLTPFTFWLLIKKRPRSYQVFAALLCFAGIFLLIYKGSFEKINYGDFLTLICGLLFAFHISLLGIYSARFDTIALTIVQMGVCALIATLGALVFDDLPEKLSGATIASVLYLGLLSTSFAYLVQTVAQKHTPPSHISLIMSLESAIGAILSVIIFKDSFTPLMWLGSILTFASVIISQYSHGKRGKQEKIKAQ
ncbi:MAG: DMT family transporter [Clostridiales bacterium]|mgnify:CR=1 FL=1|nr:DMT family transporter [Clostridiales bacterium]